MTMDITIHIPALDHLAQVLEGRDLAVLVDNFRRELDERLEALSRVRVDAVTEALPAERPAEAPVGAPEPTSAKLSDAPVTPTPDPVPADTEAPVPLTQPTQPTGRERESATSPSEPKVSPGVAAAAPCGPTEPTPDMGAIRNACAALRDEGKLAAVQALLKEHGVKNLSALKPEQLGSFADGLRKLGARI